VFTPAQNSSCLKLLESVRRGTGQWGTAAEPGGVPRGGAVRPAVTGSRRQRVAEAARLVCAAQFVPQGRFHDDSLALDGAPGERGREGAYPARVVPVPRCEQAHVVVCVVDRCDSELNCCKQRLCMSVAGSDCEWNPDSQLVLAAFAGLIPKGGAAVGDGGWRRQNNGRQAGGLKAG